MKYYVYAGYYENYISGHKLPKPYVLRDEFKSFGEAFDFLYDNWPDDQIFFTKDVADEAEKYGVLDDWNYDDLVINESKKSIKKYRTVGLEQEVRDEIEIVLDKGDIFDKKMTDNVVTSDGDKSEITNEGNVYKSYVLFVNESVKPKNSKLAKLFDDIVSEYDYDNEDHEDWALFVGVWCGISEIDEGIEVEVRMEIEDEYGKVLVDNYKSNEFVISEDEKDLSKIIENGIKEVTETL